MGIPIIKCQQCGYIFSLSYQEGRNARGQLEAYLALDPEHACLGGFMMELAKLPELEFDPEKETRLEEWERRDR